MSDPHDQIRVRMRELERAFAAFEKGDRSRLFESRDALTALSDAVDKSGSETLGPICEIASRLLGVVLMEGALSEVRAVQVVRELLSFIEAQALTVTAADPAGSPGGVFHVVNSEKVGSLLVRRGLIEPDQLEKALLLQRVSKGKRVGQVLVAMNAIDQRTLESVLDDQKAETRRAETRRGSGGGGSTESNMPSTAAIPLEPLPPMPDVGAPLPALPSAPKETTAPESEAPMVDPTPSPLPPPPIQS